MAEDSALTRFANSEIHQNVAETNVTINLRVVVGKRVGVASSGRTDARGPPPSGRERRGDRPGRGGARGLGRPARADRDPRRRRRVQPDDRRCQPGVPGRGRPGRDRRRGRCRASSPTARSRPATESIAVANSAGARASGTRTTSQLITVSMGPDGGSGYAESAAVDALDDRCRRARPRGVGQGAGDGQRGLGRPRRLPGRARGIRRRRPARHARLPRVLGPRRPGGAQLLRGRQADRQRPRDDRRRRRRPGRAAALVRLRGCRQAARRARRSRASAARSSTTRRRPPATAWRRPVTACPPRTRGARSR